MVKVMPTQNSHYWLQKATRVFCAGGGCLLAIVGRAIPVYAQAPDSSPSDDWLSSIFSTYGISIGLVGLLIGLLVFRKVRAAQRAKEIAELKSSRSMRPEHAPAASTQSPEHRVHESMVRTPQNFPTAAPTVEFEPPTYGAYRIDQEVGKLVLGKPHRMDVMASRVPEDRRAIEASLIKALASYDTGEEGRRRVREAL